ncbi:MAG: hypothetical protein IKW74_03215, partial [Thermoguttaceae bacterium]|nr:hypothetical protein [Thermoguttaceae bacterium]
SKIVNLTDKMDANGFLKWDVPEGDWTIMRFGVTSNGANTRPAPIPGFGFETSKLDRKAFDIHVKHFIGKLLDKIGKHDPNQEYGWTHFHLDSWEMGSQNWSDDFAGEFKRRRGYDMTLWLPAYLGNVVGSEEKTERFLWDVRRTAQELLLQNHTEYMKSIAHENGLKFSIEPYDMNPCSDFALGATADVPMCEFWSRGGFNTVFSVFEAASLSHILGKHYVPAEAFTSGQDGWRSWPGSMKKLNDWAFGAGVNRITFHRATHQPEEGKFPGMTMAFYGVHWERTQSWWPLVSGFHKYLARSQFLLQSGNTVADILYLLPEDSPQVFTPPASATLGRTIQSVNGNDIAYGDDIYRDRRGYNFDVCDTTLFIKEADVQEGRIVFPSGMSYSLLVLPDVTLMTPELLARLDELVEKGAKILVSGRPEKSPSLAGYPECDQKVRQLSDKIWNDEALKNQVFHATVRQNRTPAWQGAKWVWYPEDMNPATSAPEETRYFRRTITVPDLKALNCVTAIISADNSCSLTVNGNYVGTCGTFHEAAVMDATSFFRQGENLIEITANNSVTGERNPAGLIAQFDLDFNGNVVNVVTDSEWETSRTADFAEPVSALVLTENVPWPIPAINVMKGEIYPDYSATSAVFAELGVVPDFESSQDLFRYTHRRIPADGVQGACDCYFVSNRADVPVTAEVRFRMTGKAVSLWNPMNGKRYRLADSDQRQVREENSQTVFPLSLDSADSIFVVFEDADKVDDLALLEPWQPLSPRETLLDITDNWDVAFDTRFGGPSSTHFDRLIDWSASPDPGIRYFSGMVTCTREFELPASEVGQSLELDLGDVEVMARVIVNGHDCGIFWKAPYRVDITDAVVAGTNKLEVQVANLWGNRLIGDSALPEEQRFTRTTWSPYRPDDKLFPSGLIGPVKLQKVK